MQKTINKLLELVNNFGEEKKDFHKRMQEISNNTMISDSYKSQLQEEERTKQQQKEALMLEEFNRLTSTLRDKITERENTWINKDNPALNNILSMVQIHVQPTKAMIEPMRGDLISMRALSEGLKRNQLQDIAAEYAPTSNKIDDVILSLEREILSVQTNNGAYWGSGARSSLKWLAKVLGCSFNDNTDMSEALLESFKLGAGV